MTLREQINQDFLQAYKDKNMALKDTLSFLRSKLTDAQKSNKNQELTDSEVLKVVLHSCKQCKQSIEEFTTANRMDLVERERLELDVLSKYLPKQMDITEIREKAIEILSAIPEDPNRNKRMGQAQGAMNKTYSGQFDSKVLSEVLNELLP